MLWPRRAFRQLANPSNVLVLSGDVCDEITMTSARAPIVAFAAKRCGPGAAASEVSDTLELPLDDDRPISVMLAEASVAVLAEMLGDALSRRRWPG